MEPTATDSHVPTHADSAAFVVPHGSGDFSLVLGGPLFQLFRKAHLEGDHLQLLTRRVVIVSLFAWLPLLLLTLGSSVGDVTRISFFRDVEVHVRLLVALPVLVAAELLVHMRLRPVVNRFIEWRIVLPPEFPAFHEALDSAVRLRNSTLLEIGLLTIVYAAGLWVWGHRVVLNVSTWYAPPGGRWQLTPAEIGRAHV